MYNSPAILGIGALRLVEGATCKTSLSLSVIFLPFASKVIPIHDEKGYVIGGVGVATSIEKANNLFEVSENLTAIVQETAASLEEITKSASNLAERIVDISDHMKEVSYGTNQIGQISKVVKGISDQSNLLGLNAAIEAARAGDAGRGFSVVADEIRKLATNSKENVSQIDDITKGIREAIDNLNNAFEGISDFADLQVGSIQQITEIVHDIGKNAQKLSTMAENRK